jgi:hypothetical protein
MKKKSGAIAVNCFSDSFNCSFLEDAAYVYLNVYMNEIISLGICDDKNINFSSYNIGKIVSSPE